MKITITIESQDDGRPGVTVVQDNRARQVSASTSENLSRLVIAQVLDDVQRDGAIAMALMRVGQRSASRQSL